MSPIKEIYIRKEEPKKTTKYYVDNTQFLELLRTYHNQKNRPKIISEELGEIFLLMVNNIAYSRNFINYSDDWKSEMKSDALYICCKYIDNFDLEKYKNPYGYFTMIIFRAYKMRIKKEKTLHTKDGKLREEIFNEFLQEEGIYKRKLADIDDEDNRMFQDLDNIKIDIEDMFESKVIMEENKGELDKIC
jgi:hypothetical protein